MRRWMAVVAAGVALAAGPAFADVTITMTQGGKGMGMSGEGPAVTYIKGNKMRNEVTMRGSKVVTIFDLDAQRMITLDERKKEAEVWDLAQVRESMGTVATADVGVKMTPTGETRQIAGYTAHGYQMMATIDMSSMGGEEAKGLGLKSTVSGPVWLSKDAPGQEDYARFYTTMAEKGFFVMNPQQAKAQPGQARTMAAMYRQMAEAGLPLATDIQIKIDAEGPMGAMLAKMGSFSTSSTVTTISTDPLSDDLFAVPAGFKTREKK
jgi:hypothetical protein